MNGVDLQHGTLLMKINMNWEIMEINFRWCLIGPICYQLQYHMFLQREHNVLKLTLFTENLSELDYYWFNIYKIHHFTEFMF